MLDIRGKKYTSYCCKSQGMADVEIWRKGHKAFQKVPIYPLWTTGFCLSV